MATLTISQPNPAVVSTESTKFDRWKLQGESLVKGLRDNEERIETNQWEIGDWIVRGEGFGEKAYAEAERLTGFDRNYLYNVVWVVKRFPLGSSLRKETDLKWSHFKELAWIEDEKLRGQVLNQITDGRLYLNVPTVRELRAIVEKALNTNSASTGQSASKKPGPLKYLSVPLTDDQCVLIKRLANAKQKSRDELLGEIVTDYLRKNKPTILKKVEAFEKKRRNLRKKRAQR